MLFFDGIFNVPDSVSLFFSSTFFFILQTNGDAYEQEGENTGDDDSHWGAWNKYVKGP